VAVGRVNEERGVVLTLVSRPFLGTLREAGEQRSGVSAQPALPSVSPQLLKAEVKVWYTESLFIVSPAVQRSQTPIQAPHDSTWPLFRGGGIKWPVAQVQFSYGSKSLQEAGSGFASTAEGERGGRTCSAH